MPQAGSIAPVNDRRLIDFTSTASRDAAEAAGTLNPGQIFALYLAGVLTQTGFVDTDGSFVTTSGGTFQTILTLDLTGFTPTDLTGSGDSAYVVDGVTFNSFNTANAATLSLGANGLTVAPNADNGLENGRFNAPMANFDLAVLLGAEFDVFSTYRAEFGVDDNGTATVPTSGSKVISAGLWNAGAFALQLAMEVNTGISASTTTFTQHRRTRAADLSDNAVLATGVVEHLDFYWQNAYSRSRFGTTFSGFVAADTLTAAGEVDFPSTGTTQAIASPHTGDFYGAGLQRLYMAAARTAAGTEAFEARFTDLRIQRLS